MPKASQTITASKLARHYEVSRKTVYEWVKQGCPHQGKRFDLTEVNGWRASQLSTRDADKKDTKAYWDREKSKLTCERIKLEIAASKGESHSKKDCSQSLLEIRAVESRLLHSLGDRVANQFPEQGVKLKAAIDKEVDEIVKRLKNGA